MKKFSILVANYNNGTFFKTCYDSIISQKYPHFENQFVFIDQKNQGQSVARNNALKIAKGEYIGFLDSDDYLLPNYFYELMKVINEKNVEIIHFNAKQYTEDQYHH